MKENTKGVLFGLGAYCMWGGFPLFFALFDTVPAFEVLVHRIIWSCVFLAVVITLLNRWNSVRAAFHTPKQLVRVFGCAVLIALNCGCAVGSFGYSDAAAFTGYIADTDLGVGRLVWHLWFAA